MYSAQCSGRSPVQPIAIVFCRWLVLVKLLCEEDTGDQLLWYLPDILFLRSTPADHATAGPSAVYSGRCCFAGDILYMVTTSMWR